MTNEDQLMQLERKLKYLTDRAEIRARRQLSAPPHLGGDAGGSLVSVSGDHPC
jgi:hypothetical protein